VIDAIYVVAFLLVGTIAVTWTIGRVVERLREPLSLVRLVVSRACSGAIFLVVAAEAAAQGGFWWLLVPLVALPGLWNLAVAAGVVWAERREEPNGSA
jgi:hypothetical protein